MSRLHGVLNKVIRQRLLGGTVVDVGPGRVWPGLMLARDNPHVEVVGVGYSAAERLAALEQAREWHCRQRARYFCSSLTEAKLPDRSADAVVSFGALRAWANPAAQFNEIARVLKTEGEYFIGDVRRDAGWLLTFWQRLVSQGLKDAYRTQDQSLTAADVRALVANTSLEQGVVRVFGPEVWVWRK
ncbi:class I SAM-dependent methyltransferase [candidate division FCPU426 bacterium]|nr:class I SAM-dependent methyltransferase [candidate division FCPU426 bacterium]